jgi:hypothetical protein
VGLFRRRQETLNERLLREAGLDQSEPVATVPEREPEPAPESPIRTPADDVVPRWPTPTFSNRRGERVVNKLDAAVTVRSATLAGDRIEFTTLPTGDVIVEREQGDGDLSPLADAIEKKIEPPYRGVAARQNGDVWGVGAIRIQVAKVELPAGERIELTAKDGAREVRVDDEPSDVEVPELVELGERTGADYCVEAERIDGDFWEVKVSPL